MKILITGGAGYIGSHVVKHLGEIGDYDLTIIDNLSTGHEKAVLYGTLIKCDLSDFKKVRDILIEEKFDAIIHFAASIVVPESVAEPLKYFMNNSVNTINLIQVAVESGIKYFIFSSTAAVYGDIKNNPVKESDPTEPINPYGMSKLMIENVLHYASLANPSFCHGILRYFNVAGADVTGKIGQSFPNATHLIKVAAETALGKREFMSIFGDDFPTKDGTGIRDYIHVDDLAYAHIALLDYMVNTQKSDIFNCGYNKGFSVKEIIETMKNVSGVDFDVKIEARRPGDPAELVADNKKILSALNWMPKYNDIELICRTALEWEKNRRY
jgi:UDP-glucose 4-epimerase